MNKHKKLAKIEINDLGRIKHIKDIYLFSIVVVISPSGAG